MKIRQAQQEDLETIMSLIDEGRKIMRSSGNLHQWDDNHPSREQIIHDITHHHSYIMEDEKELGVATFAFIPGPDPTYTYIEDGKWLDNTADYHVVHRVASLPQVHGVFRTIMDYCFTQTDNVRIDTHRDNVIMQRCILKYGFSYCGIIYLENGEPRLAYQLKRYLR